jgi:hypothetical protein
MSNDQKNVRQLRKNIPMDRFVVSVDGQRKSGYVEKEAALAEAARIKAGYPRVTVTVFDQEADILQASSTISEADAD